MKRRSTICNLVLVLIWLPIGAVNELYARSTVVPSTVIRGSGLSIESLEDGSYVLRSTAIVGDVLHAETSVYTTAGILSSSLYPHHLTSVSEFHDDLGAGQMLTVRHTGLAGKADLICEFRAYVDRPWGRLRVKVVNSTKQTVVIHSIHTIRSTPGSTVQLNGPSSEDRILSDRFSEDPALLADLGTPAGGVHLSFNSQLIYNKKSGNSLFLGALSAEKFVTVFHLRSTPQPDARILSYDVEDAGTNEALHDQSKPYGVDNEVPLALDVAPGQSVDTEPLMFAVGPDYHSQLENYGKAVQTVLKARVSSPTLIGWWSWTAYYYGVSQGTMLTNATWLKQNLSAIGYRYFQVDEGYQYARGEYATADKTAFPDGMAYLGHQVESKGLTFGLWVAPFQVSQRSWVYEHHLDWLVHNLRGEPIHVGNVGGNSDQVYALDTTNPGAQEYLRQTYRTLVNEWGAQFLKLDFMDSTSIEGVYYRPNTTGLEALRIGLEVIRSAVGNDVILDKDGSPMLTPVGILDTGRISQDTGHTFGSTHDAAPGIAARYYMNHHFYESDPDAFTVSKQVVSDRGWHGNKQPLTLDEAEASIALSAVSGGMFEIGDDLPELGTSPERLALVRNTKLIDMARLGRASIPLDLMSYQPEDEQPSIFLLKEDNRQSILTVFNWTDGRRSHRFNLKSLGLSPSVAFTATDVLRDGTQPVRDGHIDMVLPAHSVRMLKLIDTSAPKPLPVFAVSVPLDGPAGSALEMRATADSSKTPVLEYHWNFGDETSEEGAVVTHTYTQPGKYLVTVNSIGLDGSRSRQTALISVNGYVPTIYDPSAKVRFQETR
jgi:alpha-galactosidase